MNSLQNTATEVDKLLSRSIIDLGIPPCPAILNRFMSEAQKEEADYHRLSNIISADVNLSASLIKTANSPFFGTRQRVRSPNEALARLGLNTASRAVAGIVLREAFPHVPNLERFWDASARIARISGWLALRFSISALIATRAASALPCSKRSHAPTKNSSLSLRNAAWR